MDRSEELNNLSTFDLAFNLATGKYNEKDKFEALAIIKSRDQNEGKTPRQTSSNTPSSKASKPKIKKKPLKGSKAEKIQALIDEGKTAREIYDALTKKKVKVYYPEIYRLIKANEGSE